MEEETEAERLAREEAERQMQPDKAFKDPSQMSRKQRKKALEGVGAYFMLQSLPLPERV